METERIISVSSDNQRYIFRYREGMEEQIVDEIIKVYQNPDNDFGKLELSLAVQQIGEKGWENLKRYMIKRMGIN